MTGELWATWSGAAVALLAAGIASVQAGRANSAARRSADADERAAAAAERANDLAEAQAANYVARWDLTPQGNQGYQLTNRTGETAFAVTVQPVNASSFFGDWPTKPDDLGDGESLTFATLSHFGALESRFLITWQREPGGPQLTQRRPLPPQPPSPPTRSLSRS